MNRYEIARGEVPDKREPEKTIIFGFGNESVGSNAKHELFRIQPGSVHRVGIIYTDTNKLFTGTNVHFHNRYFLCKSKGHNKELCCTTLGKPSFRVVCVVIVYGNVPERVASLSGFRILPWVFPRKTYLKLNEVHKLSPLHSNDFVVSLREGDKFKDFDIRLLYESIMFQSNRKDEIIRTAIPFIKNMKSFLGQDVGTYEIGQLLNEPSRFSSGGSRNRRNSGIDRRLDQI